MPLVLGLTDGLLNALTLAGSALLGSSGRPGFSLGARVGAAALVTAAFTVFVADYAERRAHLVRASRELNLTESGRLATGRLGRRALTGSLAAMSVACAASFLGAALPLFAGAVLPGPVWLVPALAVVALAALGGALARVIGGRVGRWVVAMAVGGVCVLLIGVRLDIA
ncbi:hypothetical protein [Streptomyces sp. GZWMJZ-114]|uniref:hypothetical protein n=1 Tax=Streptomyces sp. GZWMJZ-114 TaxID=2494734 RepID=UPI001F511BCE|nr:hypothetical protein [Streptomyces sp. GZWMJZ-114]